MLEDGHMSPQSQVLKGSPNAQRGDFVGFKTDNIRAIQGNLTFRGSV